MTVRKMFFEEIDFPELEKIKIYHYQGRRGFALTAAMLKSALALGIVSYGLAAAV